MIFNSFQTIWLLPLIFVLYWSVDQIDIRLIKERDFSVCKYLLLIISLCVYFQWSVMFGVVLLAISTVTYLSGIVFDSVASRRKVLIATLTVLALMPLLAFKYLNFILHTGASALQWIGIDVAHPAQFSWAVPLGLSFYSFQAVGYVADVYRRQIAPERNFVDYLLFICFFPQILCGPISRAADLLPQLKRKPQFDYSTAVVGKRRILWGIFLKVVLADRLGLYVDSIYGAMPVHSGNTLKLAAVFYSLQIYCDFAGYSYMAVGTARLLGIRLITNFRRPYFAQSMNEFWKRWNISLTKWLTSYIYISLGGNRQGKIRTYLNIFLTFIVSGIWHGANLTFILWGALHGAAMSVERFIGWSKRESRGLARIGRTLLTFAIVTIAWIYFRSPSIGFADSYIARMLTAGGSIYVDPKTFIHIAVGFLLAFGVEAMMEYYRPAFDRIADRRLVRWTGYVVISLLTVLMGVFDSSQFIYIQF